MVAVGRLKQEYREVIPQALIRVKNLLKNRMIMFIHRITMRIIAAN